ncbi:hypothetical protein [Streptacidiphilus albus]|uniref:hypothetical protein n=1 Tax=Streptacidiphilus albus TaxID=105425 RepID=UPI00054B55F1|nr:hypothetical protein [Streptacidiphilus albus]
MLTEVAAIGYATVGAATLQGLVFLERLRRWQAARQSARATLGAGAELPALSAFVDAPADLAVACASTAFGALGGWLLAGEISGVPLALIAGAAAPELLAHVLRSTSLMNLLLSRAGAAQAEPAARADGAPPDAAGTRDAPEAAGPGAAPIEQGTS